jgi:hypothetical protein
MKKCFITGLLSFLFFTFSYSQDLDFRSVSFNNTSFKIPKPRGYNYFHNSIFKNKTIEEVTKTSEIPIEIQHFDFLVSDDLEKAPYIHIYTYKMLEGIILTDTQFAEQKNFLITAYESGGYNKISAKVFSDSNFIKNNGNVNARQSGYLVLSNTKNLLSSLLIIDDETPGKKSSLAIIESELFLKNTILTIRLTLNYTKFEDIVTIRNISDEYINTFFKLN